MNLPSEITLDALQFADRDTRLTMLLVNRRFFRVVDGNRTSLALPEVCGLNAALNRVWLTFAGVDRTGNMRSSTSSPGAW